MTTDLLTTSDIAVKSIVARLLARENLIIEFGKYDTAYFVPSSRTVKIPLNIVKQDKNVFDLMTAHEVGHALYTPDELFDYMKDSASSAIAMTLEDARIENRVKDDFPGLLTIFKSGYQKLLDEDFFGLSRLRNKADIKNLSFIDRINLKAKCGDLLDVPFLNNDEKDFFIRAMETKEFSDVAALIIEYKKRFSSKDSDTSFDEEQLSKWINNEDISGADPIESFQPPMSNNDEEENQKDDSSNEGTDDGDSSTDDDADSTGDGMPPEGFTNDASEDFLSRIGDKGENNDEENNDASDGTLKDYKKLPTYEFLLENGFVAPYKRVMEKRKAHFSTTDLSGAAKKRSNNLKIEIQKSAAVMAAEFEMKKSAWRHSRTKITDSGSIDPLRLVHYRYSDDIFKKNKIVPNGTSHGMILFVDYSGSMGTIMESVLKQLLIFTEFCRKVKIPFEVYAFTNGAQAIYEFGGYDMYQMYERFNDEDDEDRDFLQLRPHVMMNLISSKMSDREYKKVFDHHLFLSSSYSKRHDLHIDSLSATPLTDAKICSFALTDQFIKDTNNLQNISTVFLTDGGSTTMRSLAKNLSYKNNLFTLHPALYTIKTDSQRYNRPNVALNCEIVLKDMYKSIFGIEYHNVFLSNENPSEKYYERYGDNAKENKINYKAFNKTGVLKKQAIPLNLNSLPENGVPDSKSEHQWHKETYVMVEKSVSSSSRLTKTDDLSELADSFVSNGQNSVKARSISRVLGSMFAD